MIPHPVSSNRLKVQYDGSQQKGQRLMLQELACHSFDLELCQHLSPLGMPWDAGRLQLLSFFDDLWDSPITKQLGT